MTRMPMLLPVLTLLSSCAQQGTTYLPSGTPSIKLELRRASSSPVADWAEVAVKDSQPIYVSPEVAFSNVDLASSGVRAVDQGYQIVFQLKADAVTRFAELTNAAVKNSDQTTRELLAVIVDGEVVVAPFINAPITNGILLLDGPWSKEQAEQIARGIVSE